MSKKPDRKSGKYTKIIFFIIIFLLIPVFYLLMMKKFLGLANRKSMDSPGVSTNNSTSQSGDDGGKSPAKKNSPLAPTPKAMNNLPKIIKPADNEKKLSPRRKKIEKYLKTGMKYLRENKLKKAEEYFTKVITIDPENFDAYENRSMVYYNMREHRKGIKDCDKAIEIAIKKGFFEERCPEGCLVRRGAHYFNLRKFDEALRDFKLVVKYRPGFAFAYYDLGQCYYKLNDYKTAKIYFLKAIELDKANRISDSARIHLKRMEELERKRR